MTRKYINFAIVIILMLTSGTFMFVQKDIQPELYKSKVKLVVPNRFDNYSGYDILFCQNETCGRSYKSSELELKGTNLCLKCGAELDAISIGEKLSLPEDTQMAKKNFLSGGGREIRVSIVLSGYEQKSIHRPQQCLPAQGFSIDKTDIESVEITPYNNLKVTMLELRLPDGLGSYSKYYYAYWFIGPKVETASHLERLLLMSKDRVFKNAASQWAYIAISIESFEGDTHGKEELLQFIKELYPYVINDEAIEN
ncbi:MAG: exosortase-associated EpsI family protein [Kiritimatiellae bacterium]|jgi:hypothetical protein|nr:exosortase-associated EpsI family protein [Kiritimatiellia bacterium]